MAVTQQIQPNQNISSSVRAWHDVFRPSWEFMVSVGYVPAVRTRLSTFYVTGLAALDGEVSLFGDDISTAHARQLPVSTVNRAFYAVSESADDSSPMTVWGVRSNGDEMIMSVTLNGLTPVLIGSECAHINFAMYENGESMNAGDIIISTKSTAGTPSIIGDEMQLSMHQKRAHGTNPKQLTPNDQVYVYCAADLTSDKADGVHLRLYQRLSSGNVMMSKQWLLYETSFDDHFCVPITCAAGEFFEITAERSAAGTGNASVSANLTMYILNPPDIAIPGGQNPTDGLFRAV